MTPMPTPPPSGNEAYFIRIIENPPVFWCFFRGGDLDLFKDSITFDSNETNSFSSSDMLSLGVLRFFPSRRWQGRNKEGTVSQGLNIPMVTLPKINGLPLKKVGALENTFLLGRLIFIGHVCLRLTLPETNSRLSAPENWRCLLAPKGMDHSPRTNL